MAGTIVERRQNPHVETAYTCPKGYHIIKIFQPRNNIPQSTSCELHQQIATLGIILAPLKPQVTEAVSVPEPIKAP